MSYYLRLEGQDFALVKVSAGIRMMDEATFAGRASGSRIMLCSDVENIDANYNTLTAKGVTFIKPPISQPWGWRTAYFADPEGNIWEFRQAIPAASP
ncbi:MAG: VOC family protein [Anaerolineae bacterium]